MWTLTATFIAIVAVLALAFEMPRVAGLFLATAYILISWAS